MNQETGKKLEAFWKKPGIVRFYPGEPNRNVPAVVLVFSTTDNDISRGYELLLDNYSNTETKLIIKRTGSKVDLTITDNKLGKEITLKGWNLMPGELGKFTSQEQPNGSFAFMIGALDFEQGMVVIATRQPFSPHVIGGYEVVK